MKYRCIFLNAIFLVTSAAANELEESYFFNKRLLHGLDPNISQDLEFFSSDKTAPGIYNVDLVLNGIDVASRDIEFSLFGKQVLPCFSKEVLDALGVDFSTISLLNKSDNDCFFLQQIIPDAFTNFEISALTLNISIPQAFLQKMPRGYVSPEFWDSGINAVFLNYKLNKYKTTGNYETDTSFANIEIGANLNSWNIRHSGSWSQQSFGGQKKQQTYNSINSYVQKSLPKIKSNFFLGDSYTDNAVYDSIGIRGIQLASSDLMTPPSLRGYAPVVRGFANTNAKVVIKQNGIIVQETSVPPGPFEINDLYAIGYDANLDVTVIESDGTENQFTVATSAASRLVRENQFRYSVAAGQYRNGGSTEDLNIVRGAAQYGLTNDTTIYAGTGIAKDYKSILFGSVYNSLYGAFSADLDYSSATVQKLIYKNNGARSRIGYSNYFNKTKSSISINGYFYSKEYLDIHDFSFYKNKRSNSDLIKKKREYTINANQNISDFGSIYASISKVNYHGREQDFLRGNIGYAKSFLIKNLPISFNLNYTNNKYLHSNQEREHKVAFTLSFPLSQNRNTIVSSSVVHDQNQGNGQQVRASGLIGNNNNLTYGIFGARQESGSDSAGGNLGYRSRVASVFTDFSTRSNSNQYSVSAYGGAILHAGGITFANRIGDTNGLIYAPNAKGAIVKRAVSVELDSNGYAVIPYLLPYQRNKIILDTRNVSEDVNFRSTSEVVTPYQNSITLIEFETIVGKSALFDIDDENGSPIPFGSTIYSNSGVDIGIVGQSGKAYVNGLDNEGLLIVKWGDDKDDSCKFYYDLNKSKENITLYEERVVCTTID